ncbi:MAG: ATP-binding cassette domain-containing protein [bacterium]|nr:ATP-binding cassette domain-containing protein [bacterium]
MWDLFMADDVILRFNNVDFSFGPNKPILNQVNFSLRRGTKFALMGQNGAGKSTIFNLITNSIKSEAGIVSINNNMSIALSRQAILSSELKLTVREFFEKVFANKVYDIDPKIEKILEVVNLKALLSKKVNEFSGGEQARLLLASALIQNPDLLLLDEPTNNLDTAGLAHLSEFLKDYPKTCIVISHDADFLNSFTSGVLYLDVFKHNVEQYTGNYHNVVKEITARIEREKAKNIQLEKDISHRKDQANFFAQKGGHMRDVARKMREKIEELEEEKVDVRLEDKTIRKFNIPCEADITGVILELKSIKLIRAGKAINKKVNYLLKRKDHLLLSGPNGIGKTTLLKAIASGNAAGATIQEGIRVGYYRQDFSTLNENETVYKSLQEVMIEGGEETMRAVAAGFLLTAEVLKNHIGNLSEGQKGLVMFVRLVLQRPGLLILDEPTNHINFRHIPIIAEALNKYEGAMILVSHVPEFVKKIRINEMINLEDF